MSYDQSVRLLIISNVARIFGLNEGAEALFGNALTYMSRSDDALDKEQAHLILKMIFRDRLSKQDDHSFSVTNGEATIEFSCIRSQEGVIWTSILHHEGESTSLTWRE
jgi:hypothetical protein